MTNLIVEISKYLMILLMAVYTYANFRFFSVPDMERKRKVCARPVSYTHLDVYKRQDMQRCKWNAGL